jgi:hypothetical protein
MQANNGSKVIKVITDASFSRCWPGWAMYRHNIKRNLKDSDRLSIDKNRLMEIKIPHRPNLSSDISASGNGGMNADEILLR